MRNRVYKVVLAEDEPIILRSIAAKIEKADPTFKVIAMAPNGEEALRYVKELKPELLVTDILMPRMDGMALIQEAKRICPNLHIVLLSNYRKFEYARQAIHYEVKEYLLKTDTLAKIAEVLGTIREELMERERQELHQWGIRTLRLEQEGGKEYLPAWAAGMEIDLMMVAVGVSGTERDEAEIREALINKTRSMELRQRMYDSVGTESIAMLYENRNGPGTLLLALYHDEERNMGVLAEEILTQLRCVDAQTQIDVLCFNMPCKIECFAECTALLSKAMVKCRRFGKMRVYEIGENVTSRSSDKARPLIDRVIRSNEYASIDESVNTLVSFWERENTSQYQVSKDLSIVLQRVLDAFSAEEAGQLRMKLLCPYYLGMEPGQLKEKLAEWVRGCKIDPENYNGAEVEFIVECVAEQLRRNYARQISMNELAQKYHVSAPYLSKAFKKQMGITPMGYLTSIRMNEACRLIDQHPEMSMGRIGELVGYEDQNYFSRAFHKFKGQSLTEYKQRKK